MANLSGSEAKMLDLQLQMKQNNAELQSYLKELDSWEADIKKKEETLSTDKTAKDDKLPPVRNSLEKKKKKKIKKDAQSDKKTKRISSYDYRAWDKFDVDAACDSGSSSGSEYETDEEWEVERKKQAAVLEKDKGNDYFKRKDYVNAIECYTKGAELDPTNPLLPANRAMAFLKQEKYAAAELDCSVALSLDPLYTKAYLRRGAARLGLKKYEEAKADYERVLQLEPQNKQAKTDLEVTEKELAKENMVSHTDLEVTKDLGIVKAITKAPHERSKKFLRRIDIEEVGVEDDSARRAAVAKVEASQSQVKKDIIQRDNQMFERFTARSPGDIGGGSVCQNNAGSQENNTGSQENNAGFQDSQHVCDNVSVIGGVAAVSVQNGAAGGADKDSKAKADIQHGQSVQKSENLSPRELSVPTSSVQFQTDFRKLKSSPEEFYKYFKQIHPSHYTKLFGQFLDAEVLLKVLSIIKEFYIKEEVEYFSVLKGLTNVKRFSMVAMFFSKKEKEVVSDIFQHLRSSASHTEEDVQTLASKYDIR